MRDAAYIIGFSLVAGGVAWWSVPLACVVSGVLLMGLALLGHMRKTQ